MIKTIQSEFEALKRDILELKTAQTMPATFTMNSKSGTIAAGRYTRGFYVWRINYKDVGDTNAPITLVDNSWPLRSYNSGTNKQDIEFYSNGTTTYFVSDSFEVLSSRPITSIQQIDSPDPLEEWEQVRDFYPADMGSTPGWCLQNTRLGFHIYSGTYASARADMEAQQANGTLHSGTPPDYIACPIYFANYSYTPLGHVAAWDHGRVYSDGEEFPSIASVASDYMGWGEFCDGARVVQHV